MIEATADRIVDEFDRKVAGVGRRSEHVNQMQLEAQARVLLSRVVREAQCVACEHPPGLDIDEAKREVTIQIRRARKFAMEEVAREIMVALDFDTLVPKPGWPPELVDALRRVNALARMCRGPGDNSESE